jgi:tetratricopeptide (TPR) repeat protein
MLSRALYLSGAILIRDGNRDGAEALWRELLQLAERTQDAYILVRPPIIEATLAMLDGRLENVVDWAARLLVRAEEVGSSDFGRQWAPLAAVRPLLYLGRGEQALAGLDRGPDEPAVWAKRLLCLAHLGRRTEVRALLDEYVSGARGPVQRLLPLDLLESAILVEHGDAAAVVAADLDQFGVIIVGLHGADACIARHLGGAALLKGDRQGARAQFERALADATRLRFRPEIALTRLQLTELLPEGTAEEQHEALGHLDFAIEEFRAMKMQPALERALRHKGLLHA